MRKCIPCGLSSFEFVSSILPYAIDRENLYANVFASGFTVRHFLLALAILIQSSE